jgi:predicted enzyme related to lactoylglutathione lyase
MRRSGYEPGEFCWAGLATPDPARATAFYGGLFGWDAEELPAGPAGRFTLLRRHRHDIAILYRQMPEALAAAAPPHWTCFISVEDAAATAAQAGELGGAAVFRAPFDVLDAGRVAAIRDPAGAIVSLWQPRARIGATLTGDVGAWCWNELRTAEARRVKAFFAALLGWEYDEREPGCTAILHAGARAGAIREQPGADAHWLPYFGVASAEHAARAAERAGGLRLTAGAGRAVLADPQGARFGVLEP